MSKHWYSARSHATCVRRSSSTRSVPLTPNSSQFRGRAVGTSPGKTQYRLKGSTRVAGKKNCAGRKAAIGAVTAVVVSWSQSPVRAGCPTFCATASPVSRAKAAAVGGSSCRKTSKQASEAAGVRVCTARTLRPGRSAEREPTTVCGVQVVRPSCGPLA